MRKTQVLLGLLGASVLAGFGPGVAAAPFPIATCGFTVMRSVFLTADLNCTGDGITVGAPGITIDLAGHTLRGDGGAGDFGIDNTAGHDDVTVKNGVVRNFEVGIRAINAANGFSVLKVVASGNGDDGIFIDGDFASVQSSQASGNADEGIAINGSSARVQSSQASGNAGSGISIGGALARVQSSQASGNASVGIFISGHFGRVQSSRALGNGDSGITINGDSARVQSCQASGNAADGIVVSGDVATLNGNRAQANGYLGGVPDNLGFGILADNFTTTVPVGRNTATGNDDSDECKPAALCE